MKPAITYSCIAPIILGFAAAGLTVVYVVYRYNLIYVYDNENDTRGLHYPRALKQTITGLYLAEICMIGLFSIGGGFGPAFLMILLLTLTILVHISLNDALDPLMYNIPRTLAAQEKDRLQPHSTMDRTVTEYQFIADTNLPDIEDMEDGIDPNFMHPSEQLAADAAAYDGVTTVRAVEGAEEAVSLGSRVIGDLFQGKFSTTVNSNPWLSRLIKRVDFWSYWISPDPGVTPTFLLKWLHPEIFEDHNILRQMLPADLPTAVYPEDLARRAYDPPSLLAVEPRLWIPKDLAGVSRQEVLHSGKVVSITDEGAFLDEYNRLEVDLSVFPQVLSERLQY